MVGASGGRQGLVPRVRCGGLLPAGIEPPVRSKWTWTLLLWPGLAGASDAGLSPEIEAAIDQRVARTVQPSTILSVAPGDTLLVRHEFSLPASQLGGRAATDVEPLLTDVVTPAGVQVEPRGEQLRFKTRGNQVQVQFVVSVRSTSRTMGAGPFRYAPTLIERRGLGNTVFKTTVQGRIRPVTTPITPMDLARDFYGYRLYRNRAVQGQRALATQGVRVSMGGRIQSLSRASSRTVVAVREFEKNRRRMETALRHLQAAALGPDPQLRDVAKRYLKNMARRQEDWEDMPNVPIIPPTSQKTPAEAAPTDETSTADQTGVLQPIVTYQPGSEREVEPEEPSREPDAPPALDPVELGRAPTQTGPESPLSLEDTLPGATIKEKMPNQPRGLRLDDPNVGFGGGARFVYAETQARESATSAAIFYFAQAAFNPNLGIEATLPSQFVDLTDEIEAQSVYAPGNPLFALKYRFFLPEAEGRRPVLTLRGRYGLPLGPANSLPPTQISAEDYTGQAFILETYAFLPEHHDVGFGANFGWQVGWVTMAGQVYWDLFVPTVETDLGTFSTLSYGMGVGALPFGDVVGAFAELRALSILRGSGRTEAFADIGFRGHIADLFEPAVFLGIPIGSVAGRTSVQLGVELRINYDLVAIKEFPNPEDSP